MTLEPHPNVPQSVPQDRIPPKPVQQSQTPPKPAPSGPVPTSASVKKPMSLQEKQLNELQKRQAQFKSAALAAKKAGQIEQAKEYLRQAKGFDSLIEATKSGLPVDFKTLPVAPQATRGKFLDVLFNKQCSQYGDRCLKAMNFARET